MIGEIDQEYEPEISPGNPPEVPPSTLPPEISPDNPQEMPDNPVPEGPTIPPVEIPQPE